MLLVASVMQNRGKSNRRDMLENAASKLTASSIALSLRHDEKVTYPGVTKNLIYSRRAMSNEDNMDHLGGDTDTLKP